MSNRSSRGTRLATACPELLALRSHLRAVKRAEAGFRAPQFGFRTRKGKHITAASSAIKGDR